MLFISSNGNWKEITNSNTIRHMIILINTSEVPEL